MQLCFLLPLTKSVRTTGTNVGLAMTAVRRYGLRIRKRPQLGKSSSATSLVSSDDSTCNDPVIDPLLLPSDSDSDASYFNELEEKILQPRKRRKSSVEYSLAVTSKPSPLLPADAPSTFTADDVETVRKSLLPWYSREHRKFPWRPTPLFDTKTGKPRQFEGVEHLAQKDPGAPYAIWVSEVMSQQTRISVVCEYYRRWMEEFPTVQDLAEAPIEKVNELWAGLGYYRRARMLHRGANEVVKKYKGVLPSDLKSLLKIPGIGRYTAGAIASIAFNTNVPLVDGNVERVLARLRPGSAHIVERAKQSRKSDHYWELATRLVNDIECAGDFNQGLMELGATVCTPKRPRCSNCPLQSMCGAYAEAQKQGIEPSEYVTMYPVNRTAKKCKVREETVAVCVVCWHLADGTPQYLMVQRPENGLLAGLWEFPNVILKSASDSSMESSKKLDTRVNSLLSHLPEVKKHDPLRSSECGEVIHIFSHIRQRLLVRMITFPSSRVSVPEKNSKMRWISEEEMSKAAVSTQMKKVFKVARRKLLSQG